MTLIRRDHQPSASTTHRPDVRAYRAVRGELRNSLASKGNPFARMNSCTRMALSRNSMGMKPRRDGNAGYPASRSATASSTTAARKPSEARRRTRARAKRARAA